MPYGEGRYRAAFFGNEAALSKLSAEWAAALAARLPELDRRGRTFLELRAELQTDGLELAWFTIQRDQGLRLCFRGAGTARWCCSGPTSLCGRGQPALSSPAPRGNFLAFVLLEEPEWDPRPSSGRCRTTGAFPCMTEPEDGEEDGEHPVFEVEGDAGGLSLYPFPGAPTARREEAAGRCYLWPEAERHAWRHKGRSWCRCWAGRPGHGRPPPSR